ncbi:hypothetical protein E2562_016651 [Oryza meyeriana var. granulata]|uniref:cytochrome-b5 reductase n=1 Tax=Oryza meyeriana var. granulata TaxID=110450 RepID=A0A6G1EKU1_9ORYZ|nr:hypothetical protein E2562_016651 [Oryza meyeriana var. granulata]
MRSWVTHAREANPSPQPRRRRLPTYPSHQSRRREATAPNPTSRGDSSQAPAARWDEEGKGRVLWHVVVGMEFLQGQSMETTVAVAVAVVAVAAGAAFLLLRSKRPKGCLDPENFKEFKLVEKRQISHNVAKFRFSLPTPTSVLGLPIGQHINCRGKDAAGEEVIKPYTPTTLDSDLGYFELVIKMYPQGRMSHHFRKMKVAGYLSVRGPKGHFKYQPGQVRAFGMLAGGSGIPQCSKSQEQFLKTQMTI